MVMIASSSIPSKGAERESTNIPNWLGLPRDITANIIQRLSTLEIVTSACLVCPQWWNVCKDPLMWRTISMIGLDTSNYDLVEICRYAIERSSGHLEIIEIESFCTDDLLQHIAENAINLQCLKLTKWRGLSQRIFCEAVKNLPKLEVLDFSGARHISTESLEAVGRSCPLLEVLKLERTSFELRVFGDDKAFLIAETMIQLRHLSIIGNELSDDGLLAILYGCPFLESLDLQRCRNRNLCESLRKRCIEEFKDLRLTIEYGYENFDYYDPISYRDSLIDDDCYDPFD